MRSIAVLVLAVSTIACAGAAHGADADSLSPVGELQREAKTLRPLVTSPLANRFLDATAELPSIAPRTVLHDSSRTHYYTPAEAAALPDTARAKLVTRVLDESFYYNTRYGTLLAYSRPLEILAQDGLKAVAGKRILDFGHGTIGHLRLLASLGATAIGVDVDPLLPKLYGEPGDQGAVRGRGAKGGSLTLVNGHFPGDAAVTAAVGGGYDLVISKNTLKNGYIHPEQHVDPRFLVHLGVDDTTFVRRLFTILKPGGRVLIYNLCPAPNGPNRPYRPHADGRSPFSEALWKSVGFEVRVFDRDDGVEARRMAHALGWDQGPQGMKLDQDLFASYTLVVKPTASR